MRTARSFVIFTLASITIFLFITGGLANTGYLWIFVFLAYVFFTREKDLMFWVLLVVVALSISLLLDNFNILLLPYPPATLLNFFISLLFFVNFMFFFQHKKEKADRLLKQTLENFKNSQLVERFLQVRTMELERTKIAITNMTKDVLAERDRVEKERAKDAAIIESIGEGLFATGLAGNIVLINPVASELLDMKEGDVLGKFAYRIFILYDAQGGVIPEEKRPVYKTLKTGKEIDGAYLYIKKDSRKLSLNITTTPIKQRGQVIGVIGVVRDITKEKEVDRMKTEFISLASHQLRTPLSAIKWFTEMLLAGDAGKLNHEQVDFAKNISDSTERMIELVNSLLNISRIESGRIMVNPVPTDMKKLVEDIEKELSVKFKEKQQTFILSVNENLSQINIDPRLIRQVYLNLLTNAIKYTPKGGEVTVFISRKNEQLISQISDNGYGIPKHQQSKLFQKFFRAENVVKVEPDGSGLGLYLIKAIIESSKGKIWFESEEGKGTTFWFSLPLRGVEPKNGEVTLDS